MNPIGTMLGRLSPPRGNRIQAFPIETWREEFFRAREAELDCLEWIYEVESEPVNPLRTDLGIEELRRLQEASGIPICSVCADYYMAERLVCPDGSANKRAVAHLVWLMGRASLVGARSVVLPFVDESSLRSAGELDGVGEVLRYMSPAAAQAGVELHLETELRAGDLVELLARVAHPSVRVNYDIGNAAALGHPPEDLMLLGPWLGSVHVKDRMFGGGTVRLGTGMADFSTCFRLISAARFRGPFILQAARDGALPEVELARQNRQFVREHLIEAMAHSGFSDGFGAD